MLFSLFIQHDPLHAKRRSGRPVHRWLYAFALSSTFLPRLRLPMDIDHRVARQPVTICGNESRDPLLLLGWSLVGRITTSRSIVDPPKFLYCLGRNDVAPCHVFYMGNFFLASCTRITGITATPSHFNFPKYRLGLPVIHRPVLKLPIARIPLIPIDPSALLFPGFHIRAPPNHLKS